MKNNEKNILFLEVWWTMLADKSASFRHSVLDAVFAYAFSGSLPSFPMESGQQIAFDTIRSYIDQNRVKYAEVVERRKAASEARWKKRNANDANASGASDSMLKDKDKDKDKDMDKDKDKESENKDKSFFSSNNSIFSAEKKEKTIFDFSLFLLSSGICNAYKIACEDWEFNEATGWVKERERPDGSVEKVAIRQPLSWLKSNPRKRNQEFAPADGQLLAAILSKSGIQLPENADIINHFRGCAIQDDSLHLLFSRLSPPVVRFGRAITSHPKTHDIVSTEIRKRYQDINQINVTSKCKM